MSTSHRRMPASGFARMARAGLLQTTLLVLCAWLGLAATAAAQTYLPVGPQQNVAVATVTSGGWTECFREDFGANTPIATILAACNGGRLMLACSPTGAGTLQLLAQAPTADVTFDTGTGNTPHVANGTGWYFNSSYSWGFAPAGAPLLRSSCDSGDDPTFTTSPDPLRMCIHTGGGNTNPGWRCGSVTGNNSPGVIYGNQYDRVFFTPGVSAVAPDAPPAPTATAGNGQATVTFTAPANDGGSPITQYTVTSAPGGISASGAGSPIVVTGLTNGVQYTFTVVATNAQGNSPPSPPSNPVTPQGPPSISNFPDITKTYGEADFPLTAPTSNNPAPFTYTIADPAVATVSGNVVHIVGVGVTTITATQPASGAYTGGSVMAQLTVIDRPDPTQDPGVVSGIQAQVDASVRFASAQQGNILDRLRQQRHAQGNQSSNGLALNLRTGFGRNLTLSANAADPDAMFALPEGWGLWTAGTVSSGDRDGFGGGFDFDTDGLTFGADWRVSEQWLLGAALGIGWNDTEFANPQSGMDADHRSLAIYGLWRNGGNLYVDGLVGIGRMDFDIARYSSIAGAVGRGQRDGDQLFGSVTLGYEHVLPNTRLTTYGRLDSSHTTLDPYQESGLGIYDLSYGEQTVAYSSFSFGVEGSHVIETTSGPMRPYWMVEYRDAFENQSDVGINYVVLPSATDFVLGLRSYGETATVFGGGLDIDMSPGWRLSVLARREVYSGAGSANAFGLQLSYTPGESGASAGVVGATGLDEATGSSTTGSTLRTR